MSEKPAAGLTTVPRLWPFKRVYYGWAVVIASVLANVGQVPMYGPVLSVFVKPIGDDMGWSRGEISVAFALGTLFGSLAASWVGLQIDRYGAKATVVVTGMIITLVLVGLAFMQEVWQFWVLFGVGRTAASAGISLGVSTAVANWFVRKRGRAVSFLGVGLRVGQATLPLVIAPVVILFSWRHAYAMLAVVAFALIVVPGWAFMRRRPEDLGLLPDGDSTDDSGAGPEPAERSGQRRATESSWTLAAARRTRAFWLLVLALAGVVFAQTAVNLHAVASFQDRGVADAFAGVFVFVFAGTAAVSAYAWGALMDRVGVRWGTLFATLLMTASMVVLMVADNLPLALLFALLYGLGVGGWTVAHTLLFSNYFGRDHLGAIRGFAQTVAGPIGAVGPLVAGYIQAYSGSYTISFQVFLGALLVVALSLALAVPPIHPSRHVQTESHSP